MRRLLHDATSSYWTDSDLISYINRAIGQRDRDSGMNRAIAAFNLTVAQPVYPLASLAPTYPDGSLATGKVFDIMGLILAYGNQRYQLAHLAYTDLTLYQPYVGYSQVPQAFCLYGAKFAMVAPTPNQAYPTTWDCVMVSAPLVGASDEDPLPEPWTDPVPFMACSLAKGELGQSDEEQKFLGLYQSRMLSVGGSRLRMLSRPYATMPDRG